MKQLTGLDSAFLYLENSRSPLEVSSLHIYDPSTAPGGKVRFKDILATFQRSLDKSRVFRRKLQYVPFSLDHPYWVEDAAFDLEYHVRHVSLPQPRDWRQLMILIARLQSRDLDKSRPLWEAYIIEGLNNVEGVPRGSFAMFMKMHHATVDGVSGQEIQMALHNLEPVGVDASQYKPVHGRKLVRSTPGWSLAARSPFNNMRKSIKLVQGVAGALPGLIKAGSGGPIKSKPPMTPFNDGRISANRVVDGRRLDLADLKAISKSVAEVTINDVVLTIIAGALRRYLNQHDGLPEDTLIAACPVNARSDQDQELDTMVSLMNTPLHTGIEDPVTRMHAIHADTLDAKAHLKAVGAGVMTQIPMNLPAPVARTLLPPLMELAVRTKSISFNTMITNVPGIQRPIYLAGAKMLSMVGMGPVTDQAGLFHAVFSYNGEVSIAFTACRRMLPDPAFYAQCIEQSFRELAADTLGARAVRVQPSTAGPKPTRKSRRSQKKSNP